MKNKSDLRKIFKKKQAILPEHLIEKNSIILANLHKDFFENLVSISEFIGTFIANKYEISPKFLLKNYANICVPKILSNEEMAFYKINYLTKFEKNKFGILEPINGEIIIPDVILIPAIALDIKGNRLGHGKGYYDKYLANHNIKLKIGIIHDFQLIENLPIEQHDQKLDMIFTHQRKIII